MRDEFYYPSKDGNTEVHTMEWKPEGEVRAVLQISHGMVEYIERYDEFANFLCDRGYYVVGNDHLGHGKSIQSKSELGFFNEKYGNTCIIGDIHTLRQRTMKKYPNVPYFILGHSMGSALVRQYIEMYGKGLSGVIIMGSPVEHHKATLRMGRHICRILSIFRGWHHRSNLVTEMALGGYNKKFRQGSSEYEWVTSDEERLEQYLRDPLCGFTFTVNAYYQMFTGMLKTKKKEGYAMIPKNLPVFFLSGENDPVGNFGKGVEKIYKRYRMLGMQDVQLKLYPGDRHELLNEKDRDQVYVDLYDWMEKRMRA
ncbi:MAG: alpha/beta fold hydrolase [Hespellia sp.]|nr:alpha/beta fold hydrolase [Hespellia sp.]